MEVNRREDFPEIRSEFITHERVSLSSEDVRDEEDAYDVVEDAENGHGEPEKKKRKRTGMREDVSKDEEEEDSPTRAQLLQANLKLYRALKDKIMESI